MINMGCVPINFMPAAIRTSFYSLFLISAQTAIQTKKRECTF